MLLSKGTSGDTAAGSGSGSIPEAFWFTITHPREREVLGLCPQLHEVLGSCGEPMEPLSQNGNEFSGVAAGLLQTFPIITGNCSRIAKIGGKKRLKESKRVSESDSLKSHFKGVLIIILILQIQWLYF